MSVAGFVERAWRGEAGWPGRIFTAVLRPAEVLFRAGVQRRNRAFDQGRGVAATPAIPVVSVGNLSVGGTGKTPVAAWVVRTLADAGLKPGLLARGYGADELALHRRWNPDARVHADPDRVKGVAELGAGGCDTVVLDDGFQHRRLPRDLDVVLLAAEQGLPGHLLPRGPFREPADALKRAHAVVVTRKSEAGAVAESLILQARPHLAPGTVEARVWLKPAGLASLAAWKEGRGAGADDSSRAGGEVPARAVVVTSVANPHSVSAAVGELGVRVEGARIFRDHHEYRAREVEDLRYWASGRAVIVTEKDAVKLAAIPASAQVDFQVLTQELVWESGEAELEELVQRAGAGRAG